MRRSRREDRGRRRWPSGDGRTRRPWSASPRARSRAVAAMSSGAGLPPRAEQAASTSATLAATASWVGPSVASKRVGSGRVAQVQVGVRGLVPAADGLERQPRGVDRREQPGAAAGAGRRGEHPHRGLDLDAEGARVADKEAGQVRPAGGAQQVGGRPRRVGGAGRADHGPVGQYDGERQQMVLERAEHGPSHRQPAADDAAQDTAEGDVAGGHDDRRHDATLRGPRPAPARPS